MKKIFFLLPLLIFACGKNRDIIHRGSETGRLPYQTIQQSYAGDSATITLGDTVNLWTTANFWNFNVPILVNGDTIAGGGGSFAGDNLEIDTITFNSGAQIIGVDGPTYDLKIINDNVGFDGTIYALAGIWLSSVPQVSIGQIEGKMLFIDEDNPTGVYLEDIVGGGSGSGIVDTTEHDTNFVAIFTGKATIGGSEDFWYDPGVAAEMSIGTTSINEDANTLGLYAGRDVQINGADSVTVEGALRIWDSTYFMGYSSVTRYGYLYFDSVNHAMKIDSSVLSASYGFDIDIDIHKLLNDTVGGEIRWYLSKDNFTHNIDTLTPGQVIRVLRATIEYNLVQTAKLEDRVSKLERQSGQSTEAKVYLGIIIFLALLLLIVAIRK